MKDHWINIGYEVDELKPYVEPLPDNNDPARIGKPQWHKNECSVLLSIH